VTAYDNQDGDLTGTGLVELYDLHTTGGRAGNISSRGQVLTGDDVIIGGFIVGGNQSKKVVVRALGPSLANSGVANVLSDPTLELHDASGNLISSNDNWADGPDAAAIQAEGFAPSQRAESALQATLNPGSYTAIVRGVNNTSGIALVEMYDLSPPPN
ncbi:MAG TPA: DVUA0089 family protein, partial [Chthoniobacterales bacterium]